MAEERLIDDDLNKDKKYRIRKNADGEDELYVDDSVEETFGDEVQFEVQGDEEGVQQIAESASPAHSAQPEADAVCLEAVSAAKTCMEEGDYDGALRYIDEAHNANPYSGPAWAVKLSAQTRQLTDFSSPDLEETAKNVAMYCSDDEKSVLAENSALLEKKIIELEERAASLHVEVERKKEERRGVFLADRKRSVLWFSLTAVPFLVCLIVALSFASVMFARQDGLNMIIMIIFACISALFFISSMFTGHNLWAAMKKVSLNEQNSSTKLGREYESVRSQAEKLNTVLHSFKL